MSDTLLSILTDSSARKAAVVEASLQRELSAGAPWFNED